MISSRLQLHQRAPMLLKLSNKALANHFLMPRCHNFNSQVHFSTANFAPSIATAMEVGIVTKKLRVLPKPVVETILQELHSVDTNSDGRIETDELKNLLRKHTSVFTDDEIVEIGEYFYAGKSGGSVPFDRFIEAVDRVVQREQAPTEELNDSGNPLHLGNCGNEFLFYKPHGNYTSQDLDIKLHHREPQNFQDRAAYGAVKVVRFLFDNITGWTYKQITPDMVLQRAIYLETIAAVPGMVAAIVRHFRSLRNFQRDGGMMQMFLDEANNERMHLLSFVRLRDPGVLFRAAVIGGQFGFGTAFLAAYAISPKFCHRFVGYIEEEACTTYTKIIEAIETAPDDDELSKWRTQQAPAIARSYWKLGEEGTVLDLMYAVRADEAEHRDVNHFCSDMKEGDQNPISNTEEKLNTMLLKYAHDLMDRSPESDEKTIRQ